MRLHGYGSGMLDSEVVAAIVAGDPAGLAAAYEKYAAPLYNYCRTLLREPEDAADAVQDTFVIAASRLSGLREPDRLRSWLYAVARNECHRRLRAGARAAPLDEAPEVPDESADVSADAERSELRVLVGVALGGVVQSSREILELQLRQGFDPGEIADVLGVSRNHAHALLSRARDQLQTSLGVLLVARTGRQNCPVLDGMLKDWDGRLTVLLRKRLNRHIERCPDCSAARRRAMTPGMLLGIGLPLVATLPAGLREHALHIAGTPDAMAHRAALGHGARAFGPNGFPALAHPLRHPRPVHMGAAAAGVAVIAVAAMLVVVPHRGEPPGAAPPPPGVTTRAPGRPAATGRATGRATAPATAGATAGAGTRPGVTTAAGRPATQPSGGATVRASSSASSAATPSVAAGTLGVSPATIVLTPLLGSSLRLTASGGPVRWSISEPASLIGRLNISPMSGTLAAGASTAVSISVSGLASLDTAIAVNPGGTQVTVLLGVGLGLTAPRL
jgi:RNA polymerase sigma factor (sigma-70 family)